MDNNNADYSMKGGAAAENSMDVENSGLGNTPPNLTGAENYGLANIPPNLRGAENGVYYQSRNGSYDLDDVFEEIHDPVEADDVLREANAGAKEDLVIYRKNINATVMKKILDVFSIRTVNKSPRIKKGIIENDKFEKNDNTLLIKSRINNTYKYVDGGDYGALNVEVTFRDMIALWKQDLYHGNHKFLLKLWHSLIDPYSKPSDENFKTLLRLYLGEIMIPFEKGIIQYKGIFTTIIEYRINMFFYALARFMFYKKEVAIFGTLLYNFPSTIAKFILSMLSLNILVQTNNFISPVIKNLFFSIKVSYIVVYHMFAAGNSIADRELRRTIIILIEQLDNQTARELANISDTDTFLKTVVEKLEKTVEKNKKLPNTPKSIQDFAKSLIALRKGQEDNETKPMFYSRCFQIAIGLKDYTIPINEIDIQEAQAELPKYVGGQYVVTVEQTRAKADKPQKRVHPKSKKTSKKNRQTSGILGQLRGGAIKTKKSKPKSSKGKSKKYLKIKKSKKSKNSTKKKVQRKNPKKSLSASRRSQ